MSKSLFGAGFGQIESCVPGLRTRRRDILGVNYEKIAAQNQAEDTADKQGDDQDCALFTPELLERRFQRMASIELVTQSNLGALGQAISNFAEVGDATPGESNHF